MSAEHPLWFYWGQKHMTFLRYMTLRSACAIHDDVRLVRPAEEINPTVNWAEDQDFRHEGTTRNWIREALTLPLSVVPLDYIAPAIAALRADGVHTSDLLSWQLMATQGGTVCDMDIVFLKPLPPIRADVETPRYRYAGMREDYVPIAYLQGRPNEKWTDAYCRALAAYDPAVYQSCGTENLRPWPEPNLPACIVYPWVGGSYAQTLQYCFRSPSWPPIPDECIGIHWYAGGMQTENQRIQGPDDLREGAVAWAVKEVLNRCA